MDSRWKELQHFQDKQSILSVIIRAGQACCDAILGTLHSTKFVDTYAVVSAVLEQDYDSAESIPSEMLATLVHRTRNAAWRCAKSDDEKLTLLMLNDDTVMRHLARYVYQYRNPGSAAHSNGNTANAPKRVPATT